MNLTNDSLQVSTIVTNSTVSAQVSTTTFRVSSGTITIGNHTFNANELGELLNYLKQQNPEINI